MKAGLADDIHVKGCVVYQSRGLSSGIFPNKLKMARVVRIFKIIIYSYSELPSNINSPSNINNC